MKAILCLLAVTAVANAGFLGTPTYRRENILSVAQLLEVIFAFARPEEQAALDLISGGDNVGNIIAAVAGGERLRGGYTYSGSSQGRLSPDVTAAIVASLYGGHGQQVHRVSQNVKTHRVSESHSAGPSVGIATATHVVGGGSTGGSGGIAVSHTAGGSTGGRTSGGGYSYGGKSGGYNYRKA